MSHRSAATRQTGTSPQSASGQIPRLSDPAPARALAELTERLVADPEAAKDWLLRHKLITPSGRLPKRFGG
jgi:hypothetical protein